MKLRGLIVFQYFNVFRNLQIWNGIVNKPILWVYQCIQILVTFVSQHVEDWRHSGIKQNLANSSLGTTQILMLIRRAFFSCLKSIKNERRHKKQIRVLDSVLDRCQMGTQVTVLNPKWSACWVPIYLPSAPLKYYWVL